MVYAGRDDFNIPSGLPVRSGSAGKKVKLIGADGTTAAKGTLVLMAFDDADPLLNAGITVGENSPATRVQKPVAGDATNYGLAGIAAVVKSDPLEKGIEGFVETGYSREDIQVQVPASTTYLPGRAFHMDFATGTLEIADGSQKVYAINTRKIENATLGAVTVTSSFLFDGTHGFR